jgi:hypothetical protein
MQEIKQMLRDLIEMVSDLSKAKASTKEQRSEKIDQLMGALAKAQGSYKNLIPNEESAGGKFANLSAIRDATKEALSANGLSFYQYIDLLDEGSGAALLKSMLGHESGQWISSTARVFSGKTDRQTGNTYEYHKRMHALMLLGIAPSSNDPLFFDDNGEEQVLDNMAKEARKPTKKDARIVIETITRNEYNQLMMELDGYENITSDILSLFGLETLADLPKTEYHRVINEIRKIRARYEEYLGNRPK